MSAFFPLATVAVLAQFERRRSQVFVVQLDQPLAPNGNDSALGNGGTKSEVRLAGSADTSNCSHLTAPATAANTAHGRYIAALRADPGQFDPGEYAPRTLEVIVTNADVRGLASAAERRGMPVEELCALALHHMTADALIDTVLDDAA